MEKEIKARFLQAFDFVMAKENLTQKELCAQISQDPTYLSVIRRREATTLKASLLGSLCVKYRYLNPFWILTGEGEMQAIPEDIRARLDRIDKKLDGKMQKLIEQLIQIRTPQNLIFKKPSKS